MKKLLALVLAAVLLLSLVGCSKEAKLYEKYADVITALENKEYSVAIGKVAGMAAAEMAADENRPAPVEVLSDDWYLGNDRNANAPRKLTMRADGTCTVDGKEMLWVEKHSDDLFLEGIIVDNGENKYYFGFSTPTDGRLIPVLELATCQVNGEDVFANESLGTYVNHPLAPMLMVSWRALDREGNLPEWINVNAGGISYNDRSFAWEILSGEEDPVLSVHATAKNGYTEQYSLQLFEKDGHYVLTVTDDADGSVGFYVNDQYGYEESWSEYRYPRLMEQVRNYVRDGFCWAEERMTDNKARAYLFEQLTQLADYKDCGEYLARFVTIPSMLTKVVERKTDQLGNVREDRLESYGYDAQGSIVSLLAESLAEQYGIYTDYDTVYLTYDAAGKVSGATIGSGNNVSGVCVPTYDETGKLVSMHVQRSNGQYTSTFTYDDQGRLSRVDIPKGIYGNAMFYEYTYDDNGVLVKKVKDWHNGYYSLTSEYTYQNGVVSEIAQTYTQRYSSGYTNHYAYTYDAQGRPVSAAYTTTNSNYTYVSTEIVYLYEDLYFFDTTDLAAEENN